MILNKEWWDDFADVINRLRVVPRLMVFGYGFLIWETAQWFFTVGEPSTQQTSFVTIVAGLAPAFFALYTNSGYRKEE